MCTRCQLANWSSSLTETHIKHVVLPVLSALIRTICECLLNERGEYPAKTFGQLPGSVFKSYPDRWRSNIRFTSAPHLWHRYTTSSSSSPVVGIVGITSDTLIGMRHLGQSWTSPADIVLGSAVMGRLLHWTNSALEWSFDQEGSRALQHSCLC